MKHLLEIETDSGPGTDRDLELAALRGHLAQFLEHVESPGSSFWLEIGVVSVKEMHELGY